MHQLLALLSSQETNLNAQSTIPDRFTKHFISEAEQTFFASEQTTVLYQELKINGFVFGHFIFEISNTLSLLVGCDSNVGILHYVLKGTLDFRTSTSVPLRLLSEKQYCLGTHQAYEELAIQFTPGEHHYFQLSFSVNLLQHLLAPHGSPADFANDLLSAKATMFHSYILPFGKKLADVIHSMLHSTAGNGNELLYFNSCALQLTNRFITDANKYYRKQFWEQKKLLKLGELEQYILDHLDTDNKKYITLSACAKKMGTNSFHFKQLFIQRYHSSFSIFIRRKRMEKAMQLLGDMNAGEVYLLVGFEDLSSFSRAFHKHFGHPPGFYKTR